MTSESNLQQDSPEESRSLLANWSKQLVPHIAAATATAGTAIAELLAMVDPKWKYAVPALALSFITKLGLVYSSERELGRLKRLVHALQASIDSIREHGALISLSNPQNLETLFWKIEDCLEARDELKADLLGRVAKNGLIQSEFSDAQERDFRFAVRIIEAEDIPVLRKLQTMVIKEEETGVPGSEQNELKIMKHDAKDLSAFSIARLESAGLVSSESAYGGEILILNSNCETFLKYLGV